MPSASKSYEFSVAVSGSTSSAYEAYKICHVVGLKKRKASAIVCVFYEKRRLKIDFQNFRVFAKKPRLFPSPVRQTIETVPEWLYDAWKSILFLKYGDRFQSLHSSGTICGDMYFHHFFAVKYQFFLLKQRNFLGNFPAASKILEAFHCALKECQCSMQNFQNPSAQNALKAINGSFSKPPNSVFHKRYIVTPRTTFSISELFVWLWKIEYGDSRFNYSKFRVEILLCFEGFSCVLLLWEIRESNSSLLVFSVLLKLKVCKNGYKVALLSWIKKSCGKFFYGRIKELNFCLLNIHEFFRIQYLYALHCWDVSIQKTWFGI